MLYLTSFRLTILVLGGCKDTDFNGLYRWLKCYGLILAPVVMKILAEIVMENGNKV